MDRPQERVLQALPDPDRVATMYGELGNKLVRSYATRGPVQFKASFLTFA